MQVVLTWRRSAECRRCFRWSWWIHFVSLSPQKPSPCRQTLFISNALFNWTYFLLSLLNIRKLRFEELNWAQHMFLLMDSWILVTLGDIQRGRRDDEDRLTQTTIIKSVCRSSLLLLYVFHCVYLQTIPTVISLQTNKLKPKSMMIIIIYCSHRRKTEIRTKFDLEKLKIFDIYRRTSVTAAHICSFTSTNRFQWFKQKHHDNK